jgi:hypothetical protein
MPFLRTGERERKRGVTTPMYVAAYALGVLAVIAIALRVIERREDRIRQRQWWRCWQREDYRRSVRGDE